MALNNEGTWGTYESHPVDPQAVETRQPPKQPQGISPMHVRDSEPLPEKVQLLADDTSPRPLYREQSPSNSDSTPRATKPSGGSSFLRWWLIEILSCGLAVASLVAQILVLHHYNGKPQDSWPSDILTLNGLIAALATVCRTAFMVAVAAALAQGKWNRFSSSGENRPARFADFALFDESARGLWGSAQVLWRFKGFHIACLGAALSILSLAFGLFSQQVLALRLDTVASNSTGDTGAVARGSWIEAITGYSNSWSPLTPTKLAIYDGFLATTISVPQTTCPTGNCTWPIIPTVGVCGACVNITDKIRFNYTYSPSCILTTSSLKIEGQCGYADFGTAFTLGPASGRVFSSNLSGVPARDADNVIAEFGAIGIPASKGLTATLNDSLAAECAIWYCLQARNVSVRLGVLRDEVVETWSNASRPQYDGWNASETDNVTFTNIPKSFNVDSAQSKAYGLATMQMYAMRTYANSTFFGNVSTDGTVGGAWSSTDYAEGLYNSFDNIDAWMDRLAMSMTNDVRSNGSAGHNESARYRGTALSNQVTIVVRWAWMVYPAAMVGLSIVYLVIEMVRAARMGHVRPWKDDPLMPLYIDMDAQLREEARQGLDEPNGIEKRVGEYAVRFRKGGDGLPVGFGRDQSR